MLYKVSQYRYIKGGSVLEYEYMLDKIICGKSAYKRMCKIYKIDLQTNKFTVEGVTFYKDNFLGGDAMLTLKSEVVDKIWDRKMSKFRQDLDMLQEMFQGIKEKEDENL